NHARSSKEEIKCAETRLDFIFSRTRFNLLTVSSPVVDSSNRKAEDVGSVGLLFQIVSKISTCPSTTISNGKRISLTVCATATDAKLPSKATLLPVGSCSASQAAYSTAPCVFNFTSSNPVPSSCSFACTK